MPAGLDARLVSGGTIQSSQKITSDGDHKYQGSHSVELNPGFEIKAEPFKIFTAETVGCPNQ